MTAVGEQNEVSGGFQVYYRSQDSPEATIQAEKLPKEREAGEREPEEQAAEGELGRGRVLAEKPPLLKGEADL